MTYPQIVLGLHPLFHSMRGSANVQPVVHLYFLTNTRVSLVDYNEEEKKRLKRPTGDNSYLRYHEILTQGTTILLCKVSFSRTPGRANLTKRNFVHRSELLISFDCVVYIILRSYM